MPYTSPATQSAGAVATAAYANSLKAALDFLANPPTCEVTASGAVAIASGAWAPHAFDTETLDTDTMHSNVTNNSRITIKTAGLYIVTCGVGFASNATGYRGVGVRKNGAGNVSHAGPVINPNTTTVTYLTTARTIKLAVNDYLEMMALQTSGGALNSNVGDGLPYFTATWIGLG